MNLTNFKLDLICDISYLNEQFSSLEMIPFEEKEKERLHKAAISFLNASKKDEAILLKYHQKEFLSYFLQTTSDLEKWVKEKIKIDVLYGSSFCGSTYGNRRSVAGKHASGGKEWAVGVCK